MQSNDQMAYDRGSTIFSPDGRLYQVEYAREAVKRGSVTIGVKTEDSVVLLAEKRVNSDLLVSQSIEKIYKIDQNIGVAASGHVADARRLIDFARVQSQRDRYMYEESIEVRTLAKTIGDYIQQYTQYGGSRPFGCALLIGGVIDGEVELIESEPSGAIIGYKAACIGENRAEVEEVLEEKYEDSMDIDQGIKLAIEALKRSGADSETENIEAMIVDGEGGKKLSQDDLRSYVDEVEEKIGEIGEENESEKEDEDESAE